jgi:heme oxygenase (biliverdin-IX-beta and delta-forming)
MRNAQRYGSASLDSFRQDASTRSASSVRSGFHAHLREQTMLVHRRVEEQLDLLEPSLTLERYRRVIRAFYGFYAPVEAELAQLASARPAPPFPLPARSLLLARDLLALGASPAEVISLPHCQERPLLSSTERRAGCLYVLEGASLGGQVIARAIARNLGLGSDHGASFFVGDGDGTAARWKRVLAWLEEVGSGDDRENIVEAARQTFSTLGRWLKAQGATR